MADVYIPQGGAAEVLVPAGEYIAIASLGADEATVEYKDNSLTLPQYYSLLGTVENTVTTYGTYSTPKTFRITAGLSQVIYEVGASPSIGQSLPATLNAVTATLQMNGLAAAQGGTVTVKGGTSSTSANAGGAVAVTGGVPGATGVGGAVAVAGGAGGSTSGKGGAATVTGGAGTAGNASGGSVILAGGAPNGSGLAGAVFNRGTVQLRKQGTPATATATATLTTAQMLAGILTATPGAAVAYTMPTGTALKAALPTDLAADDSFDIIVQNLAGTTNWDITWTASTDITIVGDAVVRPTADSGTEQAGQAVFRLRFVSGVTFVCYRIA